jgi:hypothetical protein
MEQINVCGYFSNSIRSWDLLMIGDSTDSFLLSYCLASITNTSTGD